jgi:hypothetical protein
MASSQAILALDELIGGGILCLSPSSGMSPRLVIN